MRTIITWVSLLLLFLSSGSAQTGACSNPFFQFVFPHTNEPHPTCTISCGTVITGSIWKVGGDTCVNTSDTIWLDTNSCSAAGNMAEVNIKIDREGNQVTNEDFIIVDIYCAATLISTDTTWGLWPSLSGNSNVRVNTYTVECSYPDYMIIEVIIGSHTSNAKLKQLSGGSCVNCFVPGSFLLPIELSPLTGYVDHLGYPHVDLQFRETAGDQLAQLWLEKSTDGTLYKEVGQSTLQLADNKAHLQDNQVLHYPSYYRVVAMSDNGDTTFSSVVRLDPGTQDFIVSPNPAVAGEQLQLSFDGPVHSLFLMNMQGGFVVDYTSFTNKEGNRLLPLPSAIPSGIYLLVMQSGNRIYRSKLSIP